MRSPFAAQSHRTRQPRQSTRLVFLGTGAAGGTPGRGRSRRLESSLLVGNQPTVLLDLTRHFPQQSVGIGHLDAILLTHAHRDASGGLPALRSWWRERGDPPVPVFAHPRAICLLRERYARLDHCRLVPVERSFRLGSWRIETVEVPHARDPERFPTLAWALDDGTRRIVYASDVSRPTGDLQGLARRATLLVADGATYGRRIFSHLRTDRDLPLLCGWDVERILLTRIGRSAPSQEELERRVPELCPRALPAYDGLTIEL